MIHSKKSLKIIGLSFILLSLFATSISAGVDTTSVAYNSKGSASSGNASASYTSGSQINPFNNYKFSARASGSGTNTATISHKYRNSSGNFTTIRSSGSGTREVSFHDPAGHFYASPGSFARGNTSKDTATVNVK